MAGRAPIRPTPVAVVSVETVEDATTQRALEKLQDAVQDLQVQVRDLRTRIEALEAGP